ncbi:MAG: butyrate kinase [Cetobacterium sp.]|uniref:butyrate kinase n=1 Tax=Cetobacterium sp. TaxID=2071632 RepID=UPI003F3623F4
MREFNILVINPGSTSTKIAYFTNGVEKLKRELHHESEFLKTLDYEGELEYRYSLIKELPIEFSSLEAVVGRGGLLKPLKSGTYSVNEKMIDDLRSEFYGKHASNLGGILAKKIADELKIPSYIVDPVVVDEMSELAKVSGMPELVRRSVFHALNQKGVLKKYCKELGIDYNEKTFIAVHMGGGISVGLHKKGEVVDVNNALDGDGPFTPERAGTLPIGDFFKLYYTGQHSKEFLLRRLKGDGGISAYLGTNNVKEVMDRVLSGDEKAKKIIDAMCYQIAKEIGGLAAVAEGAVDAIILTGGMAYSDYICEEITKRVAFIAKVVRVPGEFEMQSLYDGGARVLNGVEDVKEYI